MCCDVDKYADVYMQIYNKLELNKYFPFDLRAYKIG